MLLEIIIISVITMFLEFLRRTWTRTVPENKTVVLVVLLLHPLLAAFIWVWMNTNIWDCLMSILCFLLLTILLDLVLSSLNLLSDDKCEGKKPVKGKKYESIHRYFISLLLIVIFYLGLSFLMIKNEEKKIPTLFAEQPVHVVQNVGETEIEGNEYLILFLEYEGIVSIKKDELSKNVKVKEKNVIKILRHKGQIFIKKLN